jgi:predicted RNase H-like HicB family nuclease
MQYTYEFELFESDGWFIAYPYDMEGATQGATVKEAALMAADWLRTEIEHRLIHELSIPDATFGNAPKEGGSRMIVSVEAGLDQIATVSASEAARILGVTPGRVTHMIRDGQLESFKNGHKTSVTRASIDVRLAAPRSAGRPRKELASQLQMQE